MLLSVKTKKGMCTGCTELLQNLDIIEIWLYNAFINPTALGIMINSNTRAFKKETTI